MAERSFAKEVQKLRQGAGETFTGEGILGITKALLENGVGYVGGYQGAPISHLMDVLADAQDILGELGVHFEASASEATATAMLAASVPSFLTGLIFQRYLATDLGWFPASGYGGAGAGFGTRMWHLVLPSITLGITNSALILRFTRASMLDILGEDYVRTARAKGMTERRVVLRHALKNAGIPIITVIGLTFALLVSGAVVTERVFNLPGMGNLVVNAVLRRDYPVIQGTLIVVAGLYVLVNLLTDLLYLVVDKRVKY